MARLKASSVVLACVLLLAWVTPARAQRAVASIDAQQGTANNPFTSPEDVETGGRAFRSRCAGCHGIEGTGNRGPDLTRDRFRHGSSDRALFMNILSGIPGTGMPSVRLSDKEMWQIVAFVRSLGRPTDAVVPGDPTAGRTVYGRAACDRCHWVNGTGGRLGPDLSGVGWVRSATHLRAAIVAPDDHIDENYRQVRVMTRAGEPIPGILLNEDAFSIQLLDNGERLRSFSKADLQEIAREDGSMMPSFAGRFDERELTDLIAFLASLRRD